MQGGFGSADAARAFAPIDSPTLANDPFAQPFAPPGDPSALLLLQLPCVLWRLRPRRQLTSASGPRPKGLPSDLIDEDLLAASDPSISLKKAFVKTDTSAKPASAAPTPEKPKAYVFRPGGAAAARRESSEVVKKVQAAEPKGKIAETALPAVAAKPQPVEEDVKAPED